MRFVSLSMTTALLLAAGGQQLTSCGSDDDSTPDSSPEPSPDPSPEPSADCTGTFLLDQVNSYEQTGSYADPFLAVTCTDDFVVVQSNGIPNFEFQQTTPNALQEIDSTYNIPRNPELAAQTTEIYYTGPVGISVTGLPIYAPNEAPQDNYGDPVLDGILDYCNGHTDQRGAYHFHARPECLFEEVDGQVHLVMGYAFDGFPIVSPFECTNSSCTQTEELQSSYVYIGGSDNAYEANQYQAGAGDLDACNGKTASDGKYRYYSTDTFPYTIGCFAGTPEAPSGGGDDGDGSCMTASDCTNACPEGSMGCTCAMNPQGGQMCVPTCTTDTDCPTGGDPLRCDTDIGICVPADAP